MANGVKWILAGTRECVSPRKREGRLGTLRATLGKRFTMLCAAKRIQMKRVLAVFLLAICAATCKPARASTQSEWTWRTGSNTAGAILGVYGTKGTPSTNNTPGARGFAASWTDSSGNLWLFGGWFLSVNSSSFLNDLWEYNPSVGTWTWVSGANGPNVSGTYGH